MNTDTTYTKAGIGIRIAAYLIDVLPAIVIGLLGLIPIVGPILSGLLLTPYWLLRDILGGSLGKLLLGLRVVAEDGGPASKGALIARNLTLAIGPAMLIIPLLDYILAPSASCIIIVVEAIVLVVSGRRVGDRIAGTVVVVK